MHATYAKSVSMNGTRSSRRRHELRWTVLPVFVGAFWLAGCSVIPEPQADPTRFFVLSTHAAQRAEHPERAPKIRLRPVEVASYARTKAIIVRRGNNELEFRDFARWGEPLEQGIARVLREELLARGARDVAGASGVATSIDHDHELTVRVLACEGEADGGVVFRAVWELSPTGEKPGASAEPARGDFRASGLRWEVKDEATLAARLSEAVGALAAEIAGAWHR